MLNLFTLIIFEAFIVSQGKVVFEGSKIFRIVGLANDSNNQIHLTVKRGGNFAIAKFPPLFTVK